MPDAKPPLAPAATTALEAQELEWSRVSRILHDNVGQVLSAIGLQLDLLRMDFNDKVPQIAARTKEIQHLLESAVVEVRDLSYEMNPAMVEQTGLSSALDRLVGRYRKSFKGEVQAVLEHDHLPRPAAIAMYRIAAQAMDNAVRHGKCSRVGLRLKPAPHATVLEIWDRGAGFSVAGTRKGRGLNLMNYYAEQAGIELTISSKMGKGTTVRAVFPASRPTKAPRRVQLKR
jgi:two-component system NarL family sensor kinase